MRVISYILSASLLAGLAAAQTAPASQTVSTNPKQPAQAAAAKSANAKHTTVKNGSAKSTNTRSTTANSAHPATNASAKSPFAPKTKVTTTSAATNRTAKAEPAQNGKQKTAQSQPLNPKHAPAVQAKVQPKSVTPSAAKAVAKPAVAKAAVTKAAVAKKEEPKKQEAKAVPAQTKAEAKPSEPTEAPAPPVAQTESMKLPSPGKRDPFVSPLAAAGMRGPSNCTTGKKCLVVDQIVLKGVVQMKSGNLALVENAGRRPYVLHENDALYNGSVLKITGDSVTFREESSDILGRPVSREVVKKVTVPSV